MRFEFDRRRARTEARKVVAELRRKAKNQPKSLGRTTAV